MINKIVQSTAEAMIHYIGALIKSCTPSSPGFAMGETHFPIKMAEPS